VRRRPELAVRDHAAAAPLPPAAGAWALLELEVEDALPGGAPGVAVVEAARDAGRVYLRVAAGRPLPRKAEFEMLFGAARDGGGPYISLRAADVAA